MSLFEAQTYEKLLASALSRVGSALDKREGSMVYNGVAPSMAELAQLYIGLDFVFRATFLSTAPRAYLIERAKERGLSPKAASCAVFRAEFNTLIPLGSRFSYEKLNFTVTERMTREDTQTGLSYKAVCETPGEAANNCIGVLIPIEYIAGLSSAKLVELLIPGEDEEDTEIFRDRVLQVMRNESFGGNQADYKEKVLGINGVAAVKVQPVWNADLSPAALIPSEAVQTWYGNNLNTITDEAAKTWLTNVYTAALNKKLTVGGTVKLTIMAADHPIPSADLIEKVQTAIDPTRNAGEGLGLAPIGHVVTVTGVKYEEISVETQLTFQAGYTWEDAKADVNGTVEHYLNDIAEDWGKKDDLTVFISHLESRILSECAVYIKDIKDTKLNGFPHNITLETDKIPALADGGVISVNV